MNVKLLQCTENPEELIAVAAQLCYSQDIVDNLKENLTAEKIEHFVNMLARMGHESPFEHVSFSFEITGLSRAASHQLVRHRIASYSQRSQRYTTYTSGEYITPPEIASRPNLKRLYEEHMAEVTQVYRNLTNSLYTEYVDECDNLTKSESNKLFKKAMEDARYVLPNAAATNLIMTMNARQLLHFFQVRCCNRAQWEIRGAAWKMLVICEEKAPSIFHHAGPACLKGKCKEGTMTCGQPYNE